MKFSYENTILTKITFCCKEKQGCPELTKDGDFYILTDDFGGSVRIPSKEATEMFSASVLGMFGKKE